VIGYGLIYRNAVRVGGLWLAVYYSSQCVCVLLACHDIDQWSSPTPGETLHLPLLGSVIQVASHHWLVESVDSVFWCYCIWVCWNWYFYRD